MAVYGFIEFTPSATQYPVTSEPSVEHYMVGEPLKGVQSNLQDYQGSGLDAAGSPYFYPEVVMTFEVFVRGGYPDAQKALYTLREAVQACTSLLVEGATLNVAQGLGVGAPKMGQLAVETGDADKEDTHGLFVEVKVIPADASVEWTVDAVPALGIL